MPCLLNTFPSKFQKNLSTRASCSRFLAWLCPPSPRCPSIDRRPRGTEEFALAETGRPRADELAEALRRRPGLHRQSESSSTHNHKCANSRMKKIQHEAPYLFYKTERCPSTFMHFFPPPDTERGVHAKWHPQRCHERRSEEFETEVGLLSGCLQRTLQEMHLFGKGHLSNCCF